jgi:hypothetical protein
MASRLGRLISIFTAVRASNCISNLGSGCRLVVSLASCFGHSTPGKEPLVLIDGRLSAIVGLYVVAEKELCAPAKYRTLVFQLINNLFSWLNYSGSVLGREAVYRIIVAFWDSISFMFHFFPLSLSSFSSRI